MTDLPPTTALDLTQRQRRLRSVTLVIIGFIVAMLAISIFHPFFHPVKPHVLTPAIRKALAAQGILILGYYTIIFVLAIALVLIAWLYVREVRVQLLMAQRDIWKEMTERKQAERAEQGEKKTRNGNDH